MKIMQVVPSFEVAGAEIMCENLIYELAKLGHEVVAVSLYSYRTAITERLEKAGIQVEYLNKKAGMDFSIFLKLRKSIIKNAPDVVHTHLYVTKYVFPIAKRLGIRVVHTIHSVAKHENSKLSRKLNSIYFKNGKAIPVALSEVIQKTITEEYNIKQENIPVVFNGIDLNKCVIKKDYSYKDNFKIMHIGRFQEVKNHKGLIDAFEIFNKEHVNSELWLIGDGEIRAEIEKLVEEKCLKNAVFFLGLQENVHKYISTMELFTLTSLYEGIPMTLIEAMGSGMPIVATNVGGISNMLDGDCATLVPVDAEKIAEAFERYYLSQALRESHGKAVVTRVEKFSARTMALNYLRIYDKEA